MVLRRFLNLINTLKETLLSLHCTDPLEFCHRMDEEVENSFSRFKLIGKEEEGFVLETKDVKQCREECERSLLGKIWGLKAANYSGLKSHYVICGVRNEI